MARVETEHNRPLSPHLSIYRWKLTMAMSILHRITGISLFFGTIFLVWWLVAAASGPDAFALVAAIYGSPIGLIVLFGFTWTLVHHMLGGLRHFVWDFGLGMDAPARDRIALLNIVGSVVITVILWAVGLLLR